MAHRRLRPGLGEKICARGEPLKPANHDPVSEAEAEIASILRAGWASREELLRAARLATFIADHQGSLDFSRAQHILALAAVAPQH